MPTETDKVIDKGIDTLLMMSKIGLRDILVRFVPAKLMYQHYLEDTKMDTQLLVL